MDIEQVLSQAESFIRHDQIAQARTILGQIIRENPQNEEAWILCAQASDKPEQVLYCLNRAVVINPTSSRARILLDRLEKPQFPTSSISSRKLEPDTQPRRNLPAAVVLPEETTPVHPIDRNAEPASSPAEIQAEVPADATGPSTLPPATGEVKKRPTRWLQRVFTILGTASLWAPWILMRNGDNTTRAMTGVQILQETIHSSFGLDVVIACLAILALPLLIFFQFKSGAAQKWGERATMALVPLAALPSLDLISSFYAGSSGILELHWGVWLSCLFYSLAGLTALVNALRLGRISRSELSAARAGRIFTNLFCFGDILVILVTVIGLFLLGKFSLIGVTIPVIWLYLGALLGLIA